MEEEKKDKGMTYYYGRLSLQQYEIATGRLAYVIGVFVPGYEKAILEYKSVHTDRTREFYGYATLVDIIVPDWMQSRFPKDFVLRIGWDSLEWSGKKIGDTARHFHLYANARDATYDVLVDKVTGLWKSMTRLDCDEE